MKISFYKISFFFLFLSSFYISHSQEVPQITSAGEVLENLQINPKLFFKNNTNAGLQFKTNSNFINNADTLPLPFIDDFSGNSGYALWLDSFAFINNNFAVNPPTIGVASFDGLDKFGYPYDFSSPASFGFADKLTSKPVDLSNLTADSSIILSFYYQPQGLGDFPETTDSLILEFLAPLENTWYKVWGERGQTSAEAQQTPVFSFKKISVTDAKFLRKGFQFRFRNKATLSGMFDLWNIDYVYLDKNRNFNDNSINDFAFVSIGNSFIKTYTSMPRKAFKGNESMFMAQNFDVELANLSNISLTSDSNRYFIYENDTLKKESVNLQTSFAPLSKQIITHSVFSSPNNFKFIPPDSESVVYTINFIAGQSGIANELSHLNDTATLLQIFDSYYAYDDGSAEKSYSIAPATNQETFIAYKFIDVFPDSLKGMYVFFPRSLYDFTPLTFRITVWNDNGGLPGSVIYEGGTANPKYSDSINEFVRYEINPPVAVNGAFYIGWKQTATSNQDDLIRIGIDFNTKNKNKFFYNNNNGDGWYNPSSSTPDFSPLIRPDFGFEEFPAAVEPVKNNEPNVNIYPNPNDGTFTIYNTQFTICDLEIYNVLEELVYSKQLTTNNEQLSINLSCGIYFLKIEDGGKNNFPPRKFVISK